MKMLLRKTAIVAAVVFLFKIFSEMTGVDPVWYLMILWFLKELS